jgi:hypothetical protein
MRMVLISSLFGSLVRLKGLAVLLKIAFQIQRLMCILELESCILDEASSYD